MRRHLEPTAAYLMLRPVPFAFPRASTSTTSTTTTAALLVSSLPSLRSLPPLPSLPLRSLGEVPTVPLFVVRALGVHKPRQARVDGSAVQ